MRRTGVLIGCLALAACSDSGPALTAADYAAAAGTSRVTYEVTGSWPDWVPKAQRRMYASITAATPTGTEQADMWLPLHTRSGEEGFTQEFARGEFVYVSAQNTDKLGAITCRILVDGEVVSENTSTGAYGIATCKGQA